MITVKEATIPSQLTLTRPVATLFADVRYFDKDGFELTNLERAYHQANKIPLGSYLNHVAAAKDWFIQPEREGQIFLDHSMILMRYHYAGEALEQLREARRNIPELLKLISIQSKWGLDISIDYIDEHSVVDVIHIEFDTASYDELLEVKAKIEDVILHTDLEDAARSLHARSHQWSNLHSDDQDDWRAQYFGLPRAFQTRKVVVT